MKAPVSMARARSRDSQWASPVGLVKAAGTVMIWARGTYEPESGGGEDTLREGYRRGDLKIIMHGERMQGSWVLVRTRRDPRGRNQWLLIKHRDRLAMEGADIVAAVQTSVVTGRTMDEIAKGKRVWHSNRAGRR